MNLGESDNPSLSEENIENVNDQNPVMHGTPPRTDNQEVNPTLQESDQQNQSSPQIVNRAYITVGR